MYKNLLSIIKRKTSIKLRIYIYSILTLVLFYFLSIFSLINNTSDIRDEKLNALKFQISKLLTKTAAHSLRRGNKTELASIIEVLIESTEITKIVIIDSENEIFYESKGRKNTPSNILYFSTDIKWTTLSANFGGIELDSESVKGTEIVIGKIKVEIDQEALTSLMWKTLIEKSYILIIVLVLIMPLVYLMANSLVSPLKEIMKNLKEFENGNYDFKNIEHLYPNEYALLSKALNSAGKSIINKQNEIEQKNKDLIVRSLEIEEQITIALELRKIADEANIRKDIIISNIDQEIRRPLKGIISSLNLVEESIYETISIIDEMPKIGEKTNCYKIHLRNSIFRLIKPLGVAKYGYKEINSIIGEVSALNTSNDNDIILKEKTIPLKSKLLQLLSKYKVIANEKNLDFEIIYQENINEKVNADWIRLAQTINILVGNAIRFTEKGKVTIKVNAINIKEIIDLSISVIDTGIGMSKNEKDFIFNMLSEENSDIDITTQGIGTGLTIAKKVAQSLGGTITLKSSLISEGSHFILDIPLKKALLKENYQTANNKENMTKHIFNVLYVGDSKINQLIIQQYCLKHSINLIIANDTNEGLDKFIKGKFDAIIIDCNMVIYDGFELALTIRKLEKDNNLKESVLFALTTDKSEETKLKCQKSHFNEIIIRPGTEKSYRLIADMLNKKILE